MLEKDGVETNAIFPDLYAGATLWHPSKKNYLCRK